MSEKVSRAKEFTSKANVVEGGPFRPPQHNEKHDIKGKENFQNKNGSNPQIQKKKGDCFICGKVGHYAQPIRQEETSTTIRTTTKAEH